MRWSLVRMMNRRPRLLLLDAGAVFAALRFDAWDALVTSYEVVVPSTVVRIEAVFYITQPGERIELDLRAEVAQGRIREAEMSAADIGTIKGRFTPEFRERLDEGELEALAYLVSHPEEETRFVSGDGPAIQAVAMLDPDCRVLALAEALERCGWSKPLPHQFGPEFLKRHMSDGSIRRIQGRGLASG